MPAQRYPIQIRLPGGKVSYEERFWNAISTPVFAEDRRMVCISHTTTDVTDKVRAEAALRENEARYRALTNATADVIYRMNPDWTQLRQLEGRGFLEDALHPHRAWLDEYIPAENQEQVSDAIAEAIRNKSVFTLEHRVRRADGTHGWTLSRAMPMLDANGDIHEWIGAASDITEQKKTERRYRTLFASIDEGFCVIDVLFDANSHPCDYRFCEVNPAFEAHAGLHNAVGKTVREMNPDHEQHWFDTCAEVLRTGQPKRFEDGSDSLDRYFDVYAFRIENDENKPKVAVLFKDISAQKRTFR